MIFLLDAQIHRRDSCGRALDTKALVEAPQICINEINQPLTPAWAEGYDFFFGNATARSWLRIGSTAPAVITTTSNLACDSCS